MSQALTRAKAGKAFDCYLDMSGENTEINQEQTAAWFQSSGYAPWCIDQRPTEDAQWPDDSVPFDSVLIPEDDDSVYMVFA